MQFDLHVKFKDTRKDDSGGSIAAANKVATAVVNTPSFRGGPIIAHADINGEYDAVFALEYTGTGDTFQCDISYDGTSLPMKTLRLILNNTRPSDTASSAVIGTGFVLKTVNYGSSEIIAGKEFNLTATFIATEGTYDINNLSVTLSLPKNITVANGTPVSYIGTVGKGKTCSVSFTLLFKATAEEGSEIVSLSITGINSGNGETVSATAAISVPVVQPERFEISNVNILDNLIIGQSEYGNISLINKGKGVIYNISLEIDCDGFRIEEGKLFVGNLEPGTESVSDISIIPIEAGQFNGKVSVLYENAKGEEKHLSYEFSVYIEKGAGAQTEFPELPQTDDNNSFLLLIVLSVSVIAILCGIYIALKIKKRKIQEAEVLSEIDYDFEEDLEENPEEGPEEGAEEKNDYLE